MRAQNIETLVGDAMTRRDPKELTLGCLRYEALRKLSPARYSELCRKNIHEGRRFDDLVDELLTK
jgi:hypothetical protein